MPVIELFEFFFILGVYLHPVHPHWLIWTCLEHDQYLKKHRSECDYICVPMIYMPIISLPGKFLRLYQHAVASACNNDILDDKLPIFM